MLYRITFLLIFSSASLLTAQTEAALYQFSASDGRFPMSALIQASDGNLYGTTSSGGGSGVGSVFKISPTGALTTLYSFCSLADCADGEIPAGGLVEALNGNFYGMTTFGGPMNAGTVFSITPQGILTTLYTFCSQPNCADGQMPFGSLVRTPNGNFFGTASSGGANAFGGTVFKITPTGALTTLYSFCALANCADGQSPSTGLLIGNDQNLYGATLWGGTCQTCGTAFKITQDGALTTLYRFCSQLACIDGQNPQGALTQGVRGAIYGTTLAGGNTNNGNAAGNGTVFSLTSTGALTTLYSFCSQANCADGYAPYAGAVQGTDLALYGTTVYGGAHGSGTVFKISPGDIFQTVYNFCSASNCADGQYPYASLVEDTSGDFFGVTATGGNYGDGVVFDLASNLAPFVRAIPPADYPSQYIKILGSGLSTTSAVTFNGLNAVFSIISDTAIYALVPATATKGLLQVKTSAGTLTANRPFEVLP